MAISLKNLKKVTSSEPPRVTIYGPEGMGKTTLANEFPGAVFLQIEDGTPAGLSIDSIRADDGGPLKTYAEIKGAINALIVEDHEFQSVAVDSLDKLEPIIWAEVCRINDWVSIETPGYGRGYKEADYIWNDFMEGLGILRTKRGMAIVLIAHSEVDRFDDPQNASYDRYDLRLHKRAAAIIKDEMDAVLFINQDVTTDTKKEGFGRERTVANGGGIRWVHTEGRPAYAAKNRYGMTPRFLYQRGKGFRELSKWFPGGAMAGSPEPTTAAVAQAEKGQPADVEAPSAEAEGGPVVADKPAGKGRAKPKAETETAS